MRRSPSPRPPPRSTSASSTSAGPITFAELDARSNAFANALLRQGFRGRRQHGHPRAQPPRTVRGPPRRGQARRPHAAAQHRLRRSAAGRCLPSAKRWPSSSTTTSSSEVVAGVRPAAGPGLAWTDDAEPTPPSHTIDALAAAATLSATAAPGPQATHRPADQRHHRHAEGRPPRSRDVAGHPRRLPVQDPAAVAGERCCSPRRRSMPGACSARCSRSASGNTLVITRRFDPKFTLAALEHHRLRCPDHRAGPACRASWPSGEDEFGSHDLSALRVIAVSGSALAPGSGHAHDGPARRRRLQPLRLDRGRLRDDRHARPTCAPHPAPSGGRRTARRSSCSTTTAARCRTGETGRIFVGNSIQFEGYTGGGNKETVAGLMSTGDVGHFDDAGRLFVDGRDDDMIVSGGENVFPARGRGAARGRTRRSPTLPWSASRIPTSEPASRPTWCGSRARARRGGRPGPREGQPGPVQGAARGRRSSTSCRATPPARWSSGSCPT